jgi:death-on-curing protein
MGEPIWLTRAMVDTIHSELLREHGGSPGIRAGGDELIESALARPRNRHVYDPAADPADLAAAYLFGLAKNHGYVDGNKRVAFASAATFLLLNGQPIDAPEAAAYDAVIGVVEGSVTEDEFAAWLRQHLPRDRRNG